MAGAACATGDGDDIMKFCPCFHAVQLMKQGATPADACRQVVLDIRRRIGARDAFEIGIIAMNMQVTATNDTTLYRVQLMVCHFILRMVYDLCSLQFEIVSFLHACCFHAFTQRSLNCRSTPMWVCLGHMKLLAAHFLWTSKPFVLWCLQRVLRGFQIQIWLYKSCTSITITAKTNILCGMGSVHVCYVLNKIWLNTYFWFEHSPQYEREASLKRRTNERQNERLSVQRV